MFDSLMTAYELSPKFGLVIIGLFGLFLCYSQFKFGNLKDVLIPSREDAHRFGTRYTRYMAKDLVKTERAFADSFINFFKGVLNDLRIAGSFCETNDVFIHDSFECKVFESDAQPVYREIAREILGYWHSNCEYSLKMTSSFVIKLAFDSAIEKLSQAHVHNADSFKDRVYMTIANLVGQYDFPVSCTEDFVEA